MPARTALFGFTLLLAAALALLKLPHVRAQSWVDDRLHAEGDGLRFADFELRGGLGAQVGWVSDVFLADERDESAALRITPHLELATQGSRREQPGLRKLDVFADVDAAFKHYFAADADSDVAVGQSLSMTLRPGSILGIDFFEGLRRSIDPFMDARPLPPGGRLASYGRDRFHIGTRVQLASPGEVLKAGVAYRFDLDHFEDALFRDDRNRMHTVAGDLNWEFYPRTALFWNASARFFEYTDVAPAPRASRLDTTYVDSRVGLHGAITSQLGLTVAMGYAAASAQNDHDHDIVSGQLEIRYRVRDASDAIAWAAAYERGLEPSFQGDFVTFDRLRTRVDAPVSRALSVSFRGELSFLNFGRDVELLRAEADPDRQDLQLRGTLSGDYRVFPWGALTAELGYVRNFSDFVFPLSDEISDEAAYAQFQAWLGVRAFF